MTATIPSLHTFSLYFYIDREETRLGSKTIMIRWSLALTQQQMVFYFTKHY